MPADFKEYLLRHKAFFIFYAILAVCCIAALCLTYNNESWYSDTIAKVISVEESEKGEEFGMDGVGEKSYLQTLSLEIINGTDYGKTLTLENSYSESRAYDSRFNRGDRVFLTLENDEYKISGLKRDFELLLMFVIFLLAISFVGRDKGLLSVISVIFNIAVFTTAVYFYMKGVNLLLASIAAAVIFSVVCLFIMNGPGRKTRAAILSTIAGTAFTFIFSMTVINLTKYSGVYAESTSFLIIDLDYKLLFSSELLIGGLGAIMDIAMTMSSSLSELIENDPSISRTELKKSAKNIGSDVMNTMINVLFFTYMCGCIPSMILMMKNEMDIATYTRYFLSLEITRFLVGSIGIAASIPMSRAISVAVLNSKKKDERKIGQ